MRMRSASPSSSVRTLVRACGAPEAEYRQVGLRGPVEGAPQTVVLTAALARHAEVGSLLLVASRHQLDVEHLLHQGVGVQPLRQRIVGGGLGGEALRRGTRLTGAGAEHRRAVAPRSDPAARLAHLALGGQVVVVTHAPCWQLLRVTLSVSQLVSPSA